MIKQTIKGLLVIATALVATVLVVAILTIIITAVATVLGVAKSVVFMWLVFVAILLILANFIGWIMED